jgi:glycosyltransferase involved in cell wall biosynthesis
VTVEALAATADVVHCHMDYRGLFQRMRSTVEPYQRAAITYHGSLPPGDPRRTFVDADTDRKLHAVRFGARPYHHRWGVEHWLPIPMPVRDYQALRAANRAPLDGRPFRIAHSPTRREIKGTAEFLRAVDYVRDHMGLRVEAVLIEDMPHGQALAAKASCDAVFDSFWLGMQGSGLEAASMALPVIAGDFDAAADLAKLGIECPWTFADDEHALRLTIARLIQEPSWAASEGERVHAYTVAHHDYPVVGAKYAHILTEATSGASEYR